METMWNLFKNVNQSISKEISGVAENTFRENQNFPFITFVISLIALGGIMKLSSKVKSSRKTIKSDSSKMSSSAIPELPSYPLIGTLYPLLRNDLETVIKSWISTYGTTFRTKIFGKEIVLLSNPAWAQKLLSSTDPGHLKKLSLAYDAMFPGIMRGGLAATSNIPVWKHHRTILSKAFSLDSIKAYLTIFNRHAQKTVNDLNSLIRENEDDSTFTTKSKNMHELLHHFTFHTITEIILGVDTLSPEDVTTVYKEFARGQEIISYRLSQPWLVYDSIWKFDSKKKELDNLLSRLKEIIEKALDKGNENTREDNGVKSFVDFMTNAGLSRTEIISEVTNSFSAGYDTVSITLNFFLLNMAMYPEYQNECQKEVDEVFRSLCLSNREVTLEVVYEMKYLERCIKESLRLYPSIPYFARELGSAFKIDEDLVLKRNTLVVISPTLIHRDPDMYPEPEKFDPDRFLPENSKSFLYLPFSLGLRNCIGSKLGMIQVKLLASYILRNFEIYVDHSSEKMKETLSYSVWPSRDLGVRWRKRR